VRPLLLDSVYAPEVGGVARSQGLPDEAIAALTAACDAQPECVAANGHVDQQLAKAVAAFDADPETAPGTASVDGKERDWTFLLDGGDLRGGMFAAQYRAQYLPLLPSLIAGLARGDRSIVPAFVSTGVPSLLDMSEGAFISAECADNARLLGTDGMAAMRKDPGRNTLYALGTAEPFCQVWNVTPDEAGFNTPVAVDVPTLVFAGTLDPITPYAESKAQADRMPDARLVTVPGGGHGDQYADECTERAATAFWEDPDADLPACVDQLSMPAFATG
jgi:pimeloyl-ACP methyl ester carboxylesterase